jgi:NAD(P)-dependent dehydrogenase (short-subunit alcohol dehydrogenase family)
MRILIAGASGAIGRALVRRLRANQHEVFALTQSRDSAAVLKEIGAEPVIADALDAAAVKAAVGEIRPDAVINELTSLPRHYTPAEMKAAAERDRKVRVEGNINLLAVLRDASVRRYLLQSSGFWYAPGPGLADESVPLISSASRESRPAPAPTGSWKRAHRRRRGSSSSRCGTGSSTAPAPGTRARTIWVIRYGSSRFRSLVRARASTASCTSTMRLGRPLPRWSARRERTTSSTETRRLSTCG